MLSARLVRAPLHARSGVEGFVGDVEDHDVEYCPQHPADRLAGDLAPQVEAAVDVKGLTGDPAAVIGGEERHGVGEVGRLADAAEGGDVGEARYRLVAFMQPRVSVPVGH